MWLDKMKNFNELDSGMKEKAITYCYTSIVESIAKNGVPPFLEQFADEIEDVFDEMNKLQTPWFIHESLFELFSSHKEMNDIVIFEAEKLSQESFYADTKDYVIYL